MSGVKISQVLSSFKMICIYESINLALMLLPMIFREGERERLQRCVYIKYSAYN